jgi:hypothetical protein
MKLTSAEYKLLDVLDGFRGAAYRSWFKQESQDLASSMRHKGLISKREWERGYVVATALGKRSHGYGKR